jgi:hypothetical protein
LSPPLPVPQRGPSNGESFRVFCNCSNTFEYSFLRGIGRAPPWSSQLYGADSAADLAELRSRAEAIAAEYTAPLSRKAGDAGLIEAARRLREVGARDRALYRDSAVAETDTLQEEDLLEAILAPARQFLFDYIEETAPTTLAAAAVKLRRAMDRDFGAPDPDPDTGQSSLDQVLEFVEREAAR